MSQATSFLPLHGNDVHTLILGTMPGQASLQAQQYYAHPRNAFWPIMLAIVKESRPSFESAQALTYQQRCALLTDNGYALWDVLASCRRPGSLDSSIERSTEVPNDLVCFVKRHTHIQRIACNGKTAERLLERHCQGSLEVLRDQEHAFRIVTLPSSSPAMASLSLDAKYERWASVLEADH